MFSFTEAHRHTLGQVGIVEAAVEFVAGGQELPLRADIYVNSAVAELRLHAEWRSGLLRRIFSTEASRIVDEHVHIALGKVGMRDLMQQRL